MSTPYIKSKDELKQFILRHLGSPVVQVEITDDQLTDCITETVDEYLPVAYSGVVERHIPITLLPGYNEYILPYSVFAVTAIHSVDMQGIGSSVPSNLFSINNFIAADLYKPGTAKIDLVGYEAINEMISTMNLMFSRKITYDFNSISKVLHLFAENIGESVIIQCYKKMDIEGTPVSGGRYAEENIYNERWIRDMAVSKAQLQWGKNLLKYTGSVLPNGGSLNADFIYNEAKESVSNLMLKLHDEYVLPVDFFIG